jgi:hypothetical protein
MAEKNESDINDSKEPELASPEEIELNDQIEIILDENDTVEPLEVLQEEVVSEDTQDESGKPDSNTFNEAELPASLDDREPELPLKEPETVISPEIADKSNDGEPEVPLEEPKTEKSSEMADEHNDGELELPLKEPETESSSKMADEQKDSQSDLDEFDDDDFIGLDNENLDAERPETQGAPQKVAAVESPEIDKSEKNPEKDNEPAENQSDSNDNTKNSERLAKRPKVKIAIRKSSPTLIVAGLTLLLMCITGGLYYKYPSFLGFKREAKPAPLKTVKPSLPVEPVLKQVEPTKLLIKSEIYLAKIKDAGLLRDELLEKKQEIDQLIQHYKNGIADLEEQIKRELHSEAITSYAESLKNRRIELNLRTIQRRRSYINGLEEPTRWIKQGSEELLFLKRNTELDLQLIDVAGGIDMNKHMRHIGAAIQKYRPSAEKLAVDRENTDLPALETIWEQIKNQKKISGKALPNVTDRKIAKEICSGNYERTAELTSISVAAAQCLSKMNGSDLFLNSLTTLSPEVAKYLFQWRGNWICINGIKELAPAAAQYLFKWEGSWISLNGINEFPPELATYLMEWEGKQLELMGLRYNKKNTDQKALKYLALWETMGGKLFISDVVRKEIERIMK